MDNLKLRVLIVDDEPAHAEAIKRALLTSGRIKEIRMTGSLRGYREIIKDFVPDIAMLDLNLPDGRAVEVLTAPAEAAPFPALVMTSYGNEEIAVEALKAGAIDYIVKSAEAFATSPRIIDRALREWDLLQERKRVDEARQATVEMLHLCNMAGTIHELMRYMTEFFQEFCGCEAVGVRLQEGSDFPYFETRGFSVEFLESENNLCITEPCGKPVRDDVGRPAYACLCGAILSGHGDSTRPCFTSRGSFWSSHLSGLLATDTAAEKTILTRTRCPDSGYESLALIPICADDETYGLFQFNDRRQGQFTAEKIALLETMIDSVAIALAKMRTEETLKETSQLNQQIINSAGEGVIVYDRDLRYQVWNPYMEQLTGIRAGRILGQRLLDVFPALENSGLIERLELAKAGKMPDSLEYPLTSDDGSSSRWCLDTSAPLRNTKGEIIGVIATVQDVTDRKRYERELEYQSSHDALTGLANRNLLTDRLGQSLIYAGRSKRIVAVLFLDLDRFKVINDSLGHSYGDQLLQMVASRLNHCVRQGDTVSRLSGDEFVITLVEVAELDDVVLLSKRILEKLGKPFQLKGHELRISASIGISLFPRDGDNVETMLRHADIAMYQAKEEGDTFRFFAPEMNLRIQGTLELEADLRRALEEKEFTLYYQPKIEISSGRITGCEALVRWQHPRRGLVSPGDFIPLAEETGLIVPLGSWVLREVCKQARGWQDAGLPPITLGANLSARQFRQNDLVNEVQEALQDTKLAPGTLELELTETMVMHDPDSAAETMHHLKELGIILSLDDFGTGYSSLNYLRRFPVDNLKIDRTFISDVTHDASAAAMVSSVVAIAHNLGIKAVAEGVETWDQYDLLAECSCDALQGFLFSRPLSADAFAQILRQGQSLKRCADYGPSALAIAHA